MRTMDRGVWDWLSGDLNGREKFRARWPGQGGVEMATGLLARLRNHGSQGRVACRCVFGCMVHVRAGCVVAHAGVQAREHRRLRMDLLPRVQAQPRPQA
jgi:hypothetical protein